MGSGAIRKNINFFGLKKILNLFINISVSFGLLKINNNKGVVIFDLDKN